MQIYRFLHVLLLLIILNNFLIAQTDDNKLIEQELELKTLFDSLFFRNEIRFLKTDKEKDIINNSIIEVFTSMLNNRGSFDYQFNKISNCGILKSPDNKFKIYNWNIRYSNGTYKFFGFIQYNNPKKDRILTWKLNDLTDSIINPSTSFNTHNNWYGALYYSILPYQQGKKTNYLLLGWKGNSLFTNKKVIEHLSFTSNGEPRFGKNVFKYEKQNIKRFILEYSINAALTLVYDKKAEAIVWDHLAPDNSSKKDLFNYYGADASYDGFKYNGTKWIYVPDIYVVSEKPKKKK